MYNHIAQARKHKPEHMTKTTNVKASLISIYINFTGVYSMNITVHFDPEWSTCLDVGGHVWGGVCLVLVVAGVAGVGVSVPLAITGNPNDDIQQRLATANALLSEVPLIDGHNDLPWNIRKFMHNKLHSFNFTAELDQLRPWSRSSWSHTDLPRLREGRVGAQFWVSYVPCESQRLNAVQLTIEQIDLIKRLIEQYPDDLRLATSADEVEAAFTEGHIASMIGVEGGHAIQNSLGVLRALRDLGVRYLTLTHTCSTPWAECARARETDLEDPNSPRGLTHFGKTVVREMNRLGLMVDLSHVSQATMKAALDVSRAPVIFSHSSVYAICKNPRNVPDDILRKVAVNGGIVMVSFYNHFLTCSDHASVEDVVAHINHVRKVAGVKHVGIGADFDGVNKLPKGLEDVSKYPELFAALLRDKKWTVEDLKLLAGQNLLRVMRDVEKVRISMSHQKIPPFEEEVPTAHLEGHTNCSYGFIKNSDD
ncbi:dipeptidase 1-like [Penaeus indicus]|uniref:dipeptidase 1-like n=1 Tax=Penaeus indicus TaxID=29960 RepID=UPI00300C8315